MSSLFCSFLILSLRLLFSSSNALRSKLSQEVVIRASSLSPSSSLTTCVVTSCFLAGCLLEASGTVGESAVQDFLVLFLGPCGVLCFLFAACFWLDVEVGSPLHRLFPESREAKRMDVVTFLNFSMITLPMWAVLLAL